MQAIGTSLLSGALVAEGIDDCLLQKSVVRLEGGDPQLQFKALQQLYPLLAGWRDKRELARRVESSLFSLSETTGVPASLVAQISAIAPQMQERLLVFQSERLSRSARIRPPVSENSTSVAQLIEKRLNHPPGRSSDDFYAQGELWIDDYQVKGSDDPAASPLVARVFDHPISPSLLLAAMSIDVPGYSLSRLSLEPLSVIGGVALYGELKTEDGQAAGQFTRVIPPAPLDGDRWVASGIGFNDEGPERFVSHIGRGVGRSHLQGFFALLVYLGVDVFSLTAGLEGRYVWPHMGFECENTAFFESLKKQFADYLGRKGFPVSEQLRTQIQAWKHISDLADYTVDRVRAGRDFLLESHPRMNMTFDLDPSFQGWKKLFKLPT